MTDNLWAHQRQARRLVFPIVTFLASVNGLIVVVRMYIIGFAGKFGPTIVIVTTLGPTRIYVIDSKLVLVLAVKFHVCASTYVVGKRLTYVLTLW